MIDKRALLDAIPSLADKRVVVIGDLFLDDYVVGRPERLSREAPVPVLEFKRRFHLPGGACNPAHNIVSLGGVAYQIGVVGDDEAGKALKRKLEEAGVEISGVVVDSSRPTTTKSRVVAEGTLVFPQQLARVDLVDRRLLDEAPTKALCSHLEEIAPQVEAILLSDYKIGVITSEMIATSLRLAQKHKKVITVDSQGDLYNFSGFDLVKCNRREAEAVLRRPLLTDEACEEAGERLLSDLEAKAILITRGGEGISLTTRDGGSFHILAANRSEVFDVTGAGDTVIAVATLALAAGLDPVIGAYLANYAAGLVVRKLGNATVTPEELRWAVENW